MPATNALLNALETSIDTLISHIGLVDETDAELTGGSPAYARIAVTWVSAGDGVIRPNTDHSFNVPASKTVAGWRGYSAATGGTDYGGPDLTPESYSTQGTYTLLASETAVRIT